MYHITTHTMITLQTFFLYDRGKCYASIAVVFVDHIPQNYQQEHECGRDYNENYFHTHFLSNYIIITR